MTFCRYATMGVANSRFFDAAKFLRPFGSKRTEFERQIPYIFPKSTKNAVESHHESPPQ